MSSLHSKLRTGKSSERSLPPEALGKTVKLEFRFHSDEIQNLAGWYIDDVEVTVPAP